MKPRILYVSKDNGSGDAAIHINLTTTKMDRTQLTDYINRVLIDRFSLISGVSSIDISGGLDKVMYVKLLILKRWQGLG